MALLARRCSLFKFVFLIGLICLLLLAFLSTWLDSKSRRDAYEVILKKFVTEKLVNEDEEVPVFDDFEDNFADLEKITQRPRRVITQKPLKDLSISPPKLSQEVLDHHKQLNLTNPGHMGKPVVLPENLPFGIQEKINKSWEIYAINEFVSRLIPLDRELPDIRPDYCRSVQYSNDLPVTSVIFVFHNEPFTMIMRSVFAVFQRTPVKLLGEIVLVDDCSDYGTFIVC